MNAWHASQPYRFHAKDLERHYAGIALMLDAYALVDHGVDRALQAGGRPPVCSKGCGQCCVQPIPVTPLEISTIHTFTRFKWPGRQLDQLDPHFAVYDGSPACLEKACPFLLENSCSVYPVRPIACRQFMVLEQPCQPGEDVIKTRPHHVLVPQYAFMHTALHHTLPWYKAWPHAPQKTALTKTAHAEFALNDLSVTNISLEASQAFFKTVTVVMQAVNWKNYHPA